jgi:hypothetical protein
VVEGHVARAAGGAITAGQLAASWDRAAGALSAQLAAQLARIPSAGELLLVADYVHLLAAALQQLGLWTAALDAALHEAQERYHELAGAEALESLRRAASRDALEPVTLHNAAEYAADVVALGLHPADAPLPEADDFPLLAPFTPLVPTMLRVLKAHTGDSCAFCGAAGEEGVRTVGRFRDALLQRVVDEVLAPQLTGSHPRGAASPLVQLAANAAALDAASAAQDAECVARCVRFRDCAPLTLFRSTASRRRVTLRRSVLLRWRSLRWRQRAPWQRRGGSCARSVSELRKRCWLAWLRKWTPFSPVRRWTTGCPRRRASCRARRHTPPPRSWSTRWVRRAPSCCPPPLRACVAPRSATPPTCCSRRCFATTDAASTCTR